MDVQIEPGKYVVAVSGGVDSMVLLDVLRQKPDLKLIVAHFNHGIRTDSDQDEELVKITAQKAGLVFVSSKANLGENASEATARKKRYEFLREVQQQYQTKAIITAHHQDDLIETIILQLARGTGRKGLTSLRTHSELVRPLLKVAKQVILNYAQSQHIMWREDSTNADLSYKRNYVRHIVMPKLDVIKRTQLLDLYDKTLVANDEIDTLLSEVDSYMCGAEGIDRYGFIMLPHAIAKEYIAYVLRQHMVLNLDRNLIERLVIAIKTGTPGVVLDIDKTMIMKISRKKAKIVPRHARISDV